MRTEKGMENAKAARAAKGSVEIFADDFEDDD